MTKHYVAIDIGASSGRLMLSDLTVDGKITLKEMHRFKNSFENIEGTDYWDSEHLINEILIGFAKIKMAGIDKCYAGIDTWAVDYCLIDNEGESLSRPVSYRDSRTKNAFAEFAEKMPLSVLYQKTGIQLQPFNTVFQLLKEDQERLNKAEQLLLIPDYLGYVFTGEAVLEKTNASTMQLLNLETRKLDQDVLEVLALDEKLFPQLVEPGTILGDLDRDKFAGYDLPEVTFITIASHDTASAVVGTPGAGEDWCYISSGTWSLMGAELTEGNSSQAAFDANFTNEWGVQGTIRFLKNIMGMWLIQEVARMQDYKYSFAELAELASQEPGFQQFVDVNHPRFLNPGNMIEELQDYCRETEQKVPQTPGELARCIYDNLALCYAVELQNLEAITGKKFNKLHIVGGGSNNVFLNQLTANTCGITVEAGPGEATAIGNLVVQMVATEGFGDLISARKAIRESFDLKDFTPENGDYLKVVADYQDFLSKQLVTN